jgi:anthranilate/para-aminobenzoate synthase component I
LGHIGYDGSAEMAMIIRTMVFSGGEGNQMVSIGVGGGITIDSQPQAELEETKLKALALLNVLGVASPWA